MLVGYSDNAIIGADHARFLRQIDAWTCSTKMHAGPASLARPWSYETVLPPLKMNATLRAGVLKCLLECTRELWSHANFVFSEDGLQMRAMDSSHVALASLELPPSAFVSFWCPQRTTLGIQLDALSIVLKSCAPNDEIALSFAVGNDHITILRGEDRQWELKLLEMEECELSIPAQSYDVSMSICSSELQRCLRDLKELGGDSVAISVNESRVSFSVDGEVGRGTAVIVQEAEGVSGLSCSYSLRYVTAFAKGAPLNPSVRMQYGPDTPICFTYDVEGDGRLEFHLASRIVE